MVAVIFNFEQVLDIELSLLKVSDREKKKSIPPCFENEVIGVQDSLYRIYLIIDDMKHLLLFLLIPHYHFTIEPNEVDRVSYMT